MKRADERIKAIQATRDPHALLSALRDPHPLVVEAAAGRIQSPGANRALLEAYLRVDQGAPKADPGCRARLALLSALARLEAPEAEEAAYKAVRTVQVEAVGFGREDTASTLRGAGAGVLAMLRSPGAAVEIGLLLYDFEPNAACSRRERPYAKAGPRAAAARSLAALGEPSSAALLAVKLKFPGEEVAEVLGECMDALVALQDPHALELLEPYLTHRDPYLAATAGAGIASAGGAAGVPVLEGALGQVAPEAQAPLVYAIASIRAQEAREALERLCDHEIGRIRDAARSAAGKSDESKEPGQPR